MNIWDGSWGIGILLWGILFLGDCLKVGGWYAEMG